MGFENEGRGGAYRSSSAQQDEPQGAHCPDLQVGRGWDDPSRTCRIRGQVEGDSGRRGSSHPVPKTDGALAPWW